MGKLTWFLQNFDINFIRGLHKVFTITIIRINGLNNGKLFD